MTDDFAENPVLDFNAYSDTIVEIIKDSEPNFTIGIYREWGKKAKLKAYLSITYIRILIQNRQRRG